MKCTVMIWKSWVWTPMGCKVLLSKLHFNQKYLAYQKYNYMHWNSNPVFIYLFIYLLKDSDFIRIFYCFSNFGTILIIKSHHVMMTFLVFDLDVLFIPYYSSFFLSFSSFCRVNCVDCSSVSQKLSIESTSNFLCICRTRICSAL